MDARASSAPKLPSVVSLAVVWLLTRLLVRDFPRSGVRFS